MKDLGQKEFLIILTGGILLAFNAGFINSVFVARIMGVSHVTGNISRFAMDVGASLNDIPPEESTGEYGIALLSFMSGAVISGLIIGPKPAFKLGNRYGLAMALESICLFISYGYLRGNQIFKAGYFAAIGCGIQNAMSTTYSGAILRTTHMTGIATDIGNIIAHKLRFGSEANDFWKIKVFLPLMLGYGLGGFLGLEMWENIGPDTMLLPAIFTAFLSICYMIARYRGVFGDKEGFEFDNGKGKVADLEKNNSNVTVQAVGYSKEILPPSNV